MGKDKRTGMEGEGRNRCTDGDPIFDGGVAK